MLEVGNTVRYKSLSCRSGTVHSEQEWRTPVTSQIEVERDNPANKGSGNGEAVTQPHVALEGLIFDMTVVGFV